MRLTAGECTAVAAAANLFTVTPCNGGGQVFLKHQWKLQQDTIICDAVPSENL